MKTNCKRSCAKKSIAILTAGVTLSLLLGGCGGSGGYNAGSTPSSNGGMDAFIAEVSRILGMTSDTAEPNAIDPINVTTPEDTAPAPVS